MSNEKPTRPPLRLVSSMSAAEQQELVDELSRPSRFDAFLEAQHRGTPTLLPTPSTVGGFQVRIDLLHVKPPIWRRLILPGNLALNRLHQALNKAMGWNNSHPHRFRTSSDGQSSCFITSYEECMGEEGLLEDDVRLDQVVASKGDKLLYHYDFRDGWEHVLKVEAVLPEAPAGVELVTGRRACPPEDVGGIWGYQEIARWVESGFANNLLPEVFESVREAKERLPKGWHPAVFDVESVRSEINDVTRFGNEPWSR